MSREKIKRASAIDSFVILCWVSRLDWGENLFVVRLFSLSWNRNEHITLPNKTRTKLIHVAKQITLLISDHLAQAHTHTQTANFSCTLSGGWSFSLFMSMHVRCTRTSKIVEIKPKKSHFSPSLMKTASMSVVCDCKPDVKISKTAKFSMVEDYSASIVSHAKRCRARFYVSIQDNATNNRVFIATLMPCYVSVKKWK